MFTMTSAATACRAYSRLSLPPVDKRLAVAASGAAQRAIWPFNREVAPDRQLVLAHNIDIAMDIGCAAAHGGDYLYRDGKPPRVKRCGRDGRIPHSHRASVERQQFFQASRLNIHPLRRDAYSDDSIVLISQVARTTDTLRWVVYPHTVEARDFVCQRVFASAPQWFYRSPRSPCPRFAFFTAFRLRSLVSDPPTSSDSLNRPALLRRTYR